MDFVDQILKGDRLTLARVISQIESNEPAAEDAIDQLFRYSGQAHLIGITGPSGAGKSTLVNVLVKNMLYQDGKKHIGVIAVDPTSPFSGGAILGDRIRMRDVAANSNVFVRSMATRGALGGLAHTTNAVSLVLDAAGYDPVIIETVGAGQAEVDVARLAHTTIVVEAPGLGDDVQVIKAGILEVADILVVNKSDRPGANGIVQSLKSMLEMGYSIHINGSADKPPSTVWIPPVLCTVALDGKGVEDLIHAIHEHQQMIRSNGDWQKRELTRMRSWVDQLFQEALTSQWKNADSHKNYQKVIAAVVEHKITPFQAVEQLLKR